MEPVDIHNDPSLLYICSPPRENEWTYEESKLFENCIAEFDAKSPDFFEKISTIISGKTIYEIKEHYEALLEDVEKIESGIISLPDYKPLDDINAIEAMGPPAPRRGRGSTWTEEEHRLYLFGMEIYGRGDWKSISRNCVKTRNPIQIASHAQKYFKRLEKTKAGPSK